MKPDHEDPNNHVPEISPDDDWDDLETFSSSLAARSALPPKRGEHGLPSKKDTKQSPVRRHEPRLRVNKESAEEESSESSEEIETPVLNKPAKKTARGKTAKKATKEVAGKASKKAAKKKAAKKAARKRTATARKTASDGGGLSEVEDAPGHSEAKTSALDPDEKIRLPAPSEEKRGRLRVNEISAREDGPGSIQRISKMTPGVAATNPKAAEEEVGRRRRRFVRGERSDWGEEGGGGSFKWMLFSGVGIVLLVVFAVFLSQKAGKKPVRDSDMSFFSQLETNEEEVAGKDENLETLEKLTNSQREASEILGIYATAKEVGDFSGFLHDSEELLPLLREVWEPTGAKEGWKPAENSIWTVYDRDNVRYGLLEGTNHDFSDFSAYFRDSDSGLKLDWKASTGFGTASFEDLAAGEGDGSEIRGSISPSDFYTFPLPEEEFRSYRLVGPDDGRTVWAYAKRDGEIDSKLLKLFMPSEITGESQSSARVVVELVRGPDESLSNQWVIKDLMGLNWLDN